MILCLDVGNTHIDAALLEDHQIKLRFRHMTAASTSDQLGLFLKGVLREKGFTDSLDAIAIASVVPSLDYTVRAACIKYFCIEPFVLAPGVSTGLQFAVDHPDEVGADLIAGLVGARKRYPNTPLIVVDFGTVTTVCALSEKALMLGAMFTAGMKTTMSALASSAENLPYVNMVVPDTLIAGNTKQAIQVGLYETQVSLIDSYCRRLATDLFKDKDYLLVGTGGFAHLFQRAHLFDVIHPDLVLEGIEEVFQLNNSNNNTMVPQVTEVDVVDVKG